MSGDGVTCKISSNFAVADRISKVGAEKLSSALLDIIARRMNATEGSSQTTTPLIAAASSSIQLGGTTVDTFVSNMARFGLVKGIANAISRSQSDVVIDKIEKSGMVPAGGNSGRHRRRREMLQQMQPTTLVAFTILTDDSGKEDAADIAKMDESPLLRPTPTSELLANEINSAINNNGLASSISFALKTIVSPPPPVVGSTPAEPLGLEVMKWAGCVAEKGSSPSSQTPTPSNPSPPPPNAVTLNLPPPPSPPPRAPRGFFEYPSANATEACALETTNDAAERYADVSAVLVAVEAVEKQRQVNESARRFPPPPLPSPPSPPPSPPPPGTGTTATTTSAVKTTTTTLSNKVLGTSKDSDDGLSAGAVAGIAIGVSLAVLLVVGLAGTYILKLGPFSSAQGAASPPPPLTPYIGSAAAAAGSAAPTPPQYRGTGSPTMSELPHELDPYDILEIAPGASMEEIHEQYERLRAKYEEAKSQVTASLSGDAMSGDERGEEVTSGSRGAGGSSPRGGDPEAAAAASAAIDAKIAKMEEAKKALDDPQTRGAIALKRLEQAYRAARENVVATTGSVRTSGGPEVEALVSYPSVGGDATAHPVTESYVGVPGVVREHQRQQGNCLIM